MDFKTKLQAFRVRVENGIERMMPAAETRPRRLHEAMRYSMEDGGKRLRPVMLIAAAELGEPWADPLPAAVAVECIHSYSLIHDDLPCMDDGDLRRGKPSCHRRFDEATAVLAGDAINTYAFLLLSRHYREFPELAAGLVMDLAEAAGSEKLIGGQMEDIESERSGSANEEQVDFIHRNKTAELIAAALGMGGRLSGAGPAQVETLRGIGGRIGIAFQMIDDILDATGDSRTLGKAAGADVAAEKATCVSLYGVEESRKRARTHTAKALEQCRDLKGDPVFLKALIRSLEHRIR